MLAVISCFVFAFVGAFVADTIWEAVAAWNSGAPRVKVDKNDPMHKHLWG